MKIKPGISPWPPFRNPAECGQAYDDPRKILKSRVFHAVALVVLYKAIRGHVSEHVMALLVFLLEQAVLVSDRTAEDDVCPHKHLIIFILILYLIAVVENVYQRSPTPETDERYGFSELVCYRFAVRKFENRYRAGYFNTGAGSDSFKL